jgi:HTH-type transcriptional regulator / antitoxin HigA
LSQKHVNEIIKAKTPITRDTALKLERVLGSTAEFWLAREEQYQQNLARLNEIKRLESWSDWAKKMPIHDLMEHGYIPVRRISKKYFAEIVNDLLRLFEVATPAAFEAHTAKMSGLFRCTRTDQKDFGAISSWIRLGEIEADKIDCPKFNKSTFEESLDSIRPLTLSHFNEIESTLKEICLKSGVILVIIPSIPRAHVSGIARWLKPNQPIIQLSLYGKTNDRIWFTFFHEVAHLLKQDKKEIFLDEIDGKRVDMKEEQDADEWAKNFLIPSKYLNELKKLRSEKSVLIFASKIKIHPGIVVGRLQHEGIIKYTQLNKLKESYQQNNSNS